ncbi:MAG TPA: MoxR family ATPase [Verrucomicrobiales bacterium]|jgi:MoxR-like ATPase|nr:MoxR family ATPase [Verrucomicrobiales bacterium]
MSSEPPDEARIIDAFRSHFGNLGEQMAGVIVGLEDVIEQILIAILCGGHCILEGVPGLAKTKLISTLASLMALDFRRIQFTPDLMPGDITGSDVLQEDHTTGRRVFQFIQGPLFANIVLADEINRTPPKTQSALLEAMEEKQLTVGGRTYALPEPFFVLATQNPIEQEGTYPLPEAQLDRFMLKITLGYPDAAQEVEVAKRASTAYSYQTTPVLSGENLLELRRAIRGVPAGDPAYEFAAGLARATRPKEQGALEYVKENVAWGAGPRATICLMLAARARAVMRGRYHVTTGDIAAVAHPVLRHRLRPTFNAESAGITTDDIVTKLLEVLTMPAGKKTKR